MEIKANQLRAHTRISGGRLAVYATRGLPRLAGPAAWWPERLKGKRGQGAGASGHRFGGVQPPKGVLEGEKPSFSHFGAYPGNKGFPKGSFGHRAGKEGGCDAQRGNREVQEAAGQRPGPLREKLTASAGYACAVVCSPAQ